MAMQLRTIVLILAASTRARSLQMSNVTLTLYILASMSMYVHIANVPSLARTTAIATSTSARRTLLFDRIAKDLLVHGISSAYWLLENRHGISAFISLLFFDRRWRCWLGTSQHGVVFVLLPFSSTSLTSCLCDIVGRGIEAAALRKCCPSTTVTLVPFVHIPKELRPAQAAHIRCYPLSCNCTIV